MSRRHSVSFTKCENGTAAVEFAFIFPLLLLAFIGMAQLFALIDAKRRIDVTASTASDLASVVLSAANGDVNATTLCAITQVAAMNFSQDPRNRPRISLQYFRTGQGSFKRLWAVNNQENLLDAPPAPVATATSAALNVHIDYNFQPAILYLPSALSKVFQLNKDIWIPLRETEQVTCNTCSNHQGC